MRTAVRRLARWGEDQGFVIFPRRTTPLGRLPRVRRVRGAMSAFWQLVDPEADRATWRKGMVTLRESLPDTVGRVAHGKERLLIKRHNRPVAAVVSMNDVRLLEMLDDLLDLKAAAEAPEEIGNGGELKSVAEFRKELGL